MKGNTTDLPSRLIWLEETDSTNNAAKKLALAGAPAGTVVAARRQTAGRGRRGRSFVSEEGGLYFSYILRPAEQPDRLLHLTALCAVAAARAVAAVCGRKPAVKWVNDLVFGQKKLGGILTELALRPDGTVDFVIVGIGVNCAQRNFPPEIADMATSIYAETGMDSAQRPLALALMEQLDAMTSALSPGPEKDAWLAEFAANCITIGKEVQVLRGDTARPAKALGIDENAGLVVEYADGARETVSSGEVSVRGMYGYV